MFEPLNEGAECRHAVGTVGGVATVASMTHARFLPSPDGGQQSAVRPVCQVTIISPSSNQTPAPHPGHNNPCHCHYCLRCGL